VSPVRVRGIVGGHDPNILDIACGGRRWRLTQREDDYYSVAMDAELDSLDAKIGQLVQLCHRLRKENSNLRQELAAAQVLNRELSERIEAARTRLESLLTRIPEDAQ